MPQLSRNNFMNFYSINKKNQQKDKLKSGVITAIVWSALLLFVFFYTIQKNIPKDKEIVTTMLMNFGDNRNGNGEEEPVNQDGSTASVEHLEEEHKETVIKESVEKDIKKDTEEKIITGNHKNPETKEIKSEKDKTLSNTKNKSVTNPNSADKTKTSTSSSTPNSKTGNGDGKGNAAIGNLIKGRGNKKGSQGNGGTIGNAGDPLGGDGNGDSKIGIDRKLIAFIPGTMGKGGKQPDHNCTASGTVRISYTVDKAGNVVSARRSGGISDVCAATAAIIWVKKYVKAETANTSSTGTYSITF